MSWFAKYPAVVVIKASTINLLLQIVTDKTNEMALSPVQPPKSHKNCLTKTYVRDDKQARFPVPDDRIQWTVPYPEYDPDDFTMPHILKGPAWADPNIR